MNVVWKTRENATHSQIFDVDDDDQIHIEMSHNVCTLQTLSFARTRVCLRLNLSLSKWQIWMNSNVNLEFINQHHLIHARFVCMQLCCQRARQSDQPGLAHVKWLMIRWLPANSRLMLLTCFFSFLFLFFLLVSWGQFGVCSILIAFLFICSFRFSMLFDCPIVNAMQGDKNKERDRPRVWVCVCIVWVLLAWFVSFVAFINSVVLTVVNGAGQTPNKPA